MVKLDVHEEREIKKKFLVSLYSSCLGEKTAQSEGSHGEASGSVIRQRDCEQTLVSWPLQEGMSKARQAGLGLAKVYNVSNFSRLWGLRAALGSLVYGLGAIKAGLKSEILIKKRMGFEMDT